MAKIIIAPACIMIALVGYALTADESLGPATTKSPQDVRVAEVNRSITTGATRDFHQLVQQQTGTVCETPQGSCTVAPKPINSACQCGQSFGRIVR